MHYRDFSKPCSQAHFFRTTHVLVVSDFAFSFTQCNDTNKDSYISKQEEERGAGAAVPGERRWINLSRI